MSTDTQQPPITINRGVTFTFYGTCRETALLRQVTIHRPSREHKHLQSAYLAAGKKLIAARLV